MYWILIYILFVFVYVPVHLQNDIRLPPSIANQWQPIKYFRKESVSVVLNCSALGFPIPRYELYINGTLNNSNTIGTWTVTLPGTYRCHAINLYGTSMTQKMQLILINEMIFFDPDTVQNVSVLYKTSNFTRTCKPTLEPIPPASFRWKIVNLIQEIDLPESSWAQINDEGTLHLANVNDLINSQGNVGNVTIRCQGFNYIAQQWASSSKTNLRFQDSQMIGYGAHFMTGSKQNMIGIYGQKITLKCLFGGFPTPAIKWFKDGSSTELPLVDWVRMNGSTQIVPTKNLDKSHEGVYMCQGESSASHEITLKVIAKPNFDMKWNGPYNVNVSEGDTVSFNCTMEDDNDPFNNTWYKDAVQLDPNSLPERYTMNANHTTLTITNVKKNPPDLAVIQCELNNIVGTAFAEGYINVLEGTKINLSLSNMNDVQWEANKNVTFNVVFKSDPATLVIVLWYFEDQLIIPGSDERLVLSSDNSTLMIIMDGEVDGGLHRCGSYRCRVSNQFSSDEKVARLVAPVPPGPPSSAGFSTWWIPLVVVLGAVALAAVALLLLCCCGCLSCDCCIACLVACCATYCACKCCKCIKDKVYPVDKKERIHGNDPVKELNKLGFHGYQSSDHLTGSKDNMGYTNNETTQYRSNTNINNNESSHINDRNVSITDAAFVDVNIRDNSLLRNNNNNINVNNSRSNSLIRRSDDDRYNYHVDNAHYHSINYNVNHTNDSSDVRNSNLQTVSNMVSNYQYDTYTQSTILKNSTFASDHRVLKQNGDTAAMPELILRAPNQQLANDDGMNQGEGVSNFSREMRYGSSVRRKSIEVVDVVHKGSSNEDGMRRSFRNSVKSGRYGYEPFSEI